MANGSSFFGQPDMFFKSGRLGGSIRLNPLQAHWVEACLSLKYSFSLRHKNGVVPIVATISLYIYNLFTFILTLCPPRVLLNV